MPVLRPPKVLLVAHEAPIRRMLRSNLLKAGYDVQDVATGADALSTLQPLPELAIIDLAVPDMDGMVLLRQLRQRSAFIPIVVVSEAEDEDRKLEAFALNVDDYVVKPFGMSELLARVRHALKYRLQTQKVKPLFVSGGLSVDLERRLVTVNGLKVRLAPKEYELLLLLINHCGKVLTHAFILKALWASATEPQYLRVYISQLRRKIEAIPEKPVYILTENGVGYKMRAPNDHSLE